MCFSATASFAAGGTLGVIGGVTVRKVKNKTELPFGLIPILFAIQQTLEGLVWLSFGSPGFNWLATHGFVLFSHVFWPVWLPFSLMMMEHDVVKRKILVFFFGVGLTVGFSQFYFILSEPVMSQAASNSIVYNIVYTVPYAFGPLMMFLYLMATCFSCAFSSHKMVKVFGLALFASFLIANQYYTVTCFSVWCFFAAILSLIIFAHFHHREHLGRK